MKGVNIFLANGFEDIEALGTCDILRRGGVKAQLVGITDEPFVTSSHGITVAVDTTLNELLAGHDNEGQFREGMEHSQNKNLSRHDVMIFPGGMPGAKNLAGCRTLIREMNAHHAAGGTLAAICAAPGIVLTKLEGNGQSSSSGCLAVVKMTCYDGFKNALTACGASFVPRPAVTSETNGRLIITGRGPGHTQAFAYEILSLLKGAETATQVLQGMNLPVSKE